MIKVSDTVKNILYSSEIALSALSEGYLNLSAYAKAIHTQVEERAKKPVQIGSIVVALSRLRASLQKNAPLIPSVLIDDISAKSGLVEIVFDKTSDNLERLRELSARKDLRASDFFMITQGAGELTIITLASAMETVVSLYKGKKPKAVVKDLAGLTLRFSENYIDVPNVIYALVRKFALRRINVVEIVSTFSELTFIIEQKNLERAFVLLNEILQEKYHG